MAKIGRNEPCGSGSGSGSGNKYKKCCLGKETGTGAPSDSAEGRRRAPLEPPSPTPPMPSGGIPPPYVIAKLLEDSEMFARMKRLEPGKAREFWTPRKVTALSTEEILTELRTLGVDASREAYLPLAKGRTSAWDISGQWRRAIKKGLSHHAGDFLGLAACELWKRYCPEHPSIEMLDDMMQEGYRFRREGQGARACDCWWEV